MAAVAGIRYGPGRSIESGDAGSGQAATRLTPRIVGRPIVAFGFAGLLVQNTFDGFGVLQGGDDLRIETSLAVQLVSPQHLQFDSQFGEGFQKGRQEMLGVTVVLPAGTGNIAQRFPHLGGVDGWIEKIVHPPQRVHGIGDVVHMGCRALVAQGPVDAFGGEYFTQVADMKLPGRRDAGAQQMCGLGLGELLGSYQHVVVPEMNSGQLAFLLQGRFLKKIVSYTKVQGKPFFRSEIHSKIRETLEAGHVN